MGLQRKLIRKAVVAALKAGNTLAGQRVYGNRSAPITLKNLPCILVYTDDEPAEVVTESPREYIRNLTLSIEMVATNASGSAAEAQDESVDDTLDDLAAQVEQIMFIDETWGGLTTDTMLGDTNVELLSDGQQPIGALKTKFIVPYYERLPGDSTGDLDDFNTAFDRFEIPGDSASTQEPTDFVDLTQGED